MKKTEFLGAEARVEIGDEVLKDRVEKDYRHKDLDERLRKDRNSQEVNILDKARKNGVRVPEVLETSDTSFKMEKIDGRQLKEAENIGENLEKLARQVARLHSADIIHGDLTTSNAIVSEGKVHLIDFGLAFHSGRVEDKAVDIHLLKQVLKASHDESHWKNFSKVYREKGEKEVVEKVPEIEERARYK